jgi:hypothetical protein
MASLRTFVFFRRIYQTVSPAATRRKTPPIVPPTIAPIFVPDDLELGLGLEFPEE